MGVVVNTISKADEGVPKVPRPFENEPNAEPVMKNLDKGANNMMVLKEARGLVEGIKIGDMKQGLINGGILALYTLPFGVMSKPGYGMTPLSLAAASANIRSHAAEEEKLEPSDDNLDDFDATPTYLNGQTGPNYVDEDIDKVQSYDHLNNPDQTKKDFIYADRDPNCRGQSDYNQLAREQEKMNFEMDPKKLGISTDGDRDYLGRRRAPKK